MAADPDDSPLKARTAHGNTPVFDQDSIPAGLLRRTPSRAARLCRRPVTGRDIAPGSGDDDISVGSPGRLGGPGRASEDGPVKRTALVDLNVHRRPQGLSDRIAFGFVKMLRFFADTFFAKRYGHRAVVLETVAAVPGMVGATLNHLRCLRRMSDDRGWIRTLLDEAENERMHLMTFIEIAQPNRYERLLVLIAQGIFYNAFFLLYLASPKTAHRVVGYFEEEAVVSYTQYLAEIDAGRHPDVPAPAIARRYWELPDNATLRDVVVAVRADEANHRDVNHGFADALAVGRESGHDDDANARKAA